MLFDLRGRGRQRTVRVVYSLLAVILFFGLIVVGFGNGGLSDIFGNGGGGSSNSGDDVFKKQLKRAELAVQRNPKDAAGWYAIAKKHAQLASVGKNFNSQLEAYTAGGVAELGQSRTAWTRYVDLDETPDPNLAAQLAGPYFAGLKDAKVATSAQQVVVLGSGNATAGNYATLARFAYKAGQKRLGDLSTQKALSLEKDKAQRAQIQVALKQFATQGTSAPYPTSLAG